MSAPGYPPAGGYGAPPGAYPGYPPASGYPPTGQVSYPPGGGPGGPGGYPPPGGVSYPPGGGPGGYPPQGGMSYPPGHPPSGGVSYPPGGGPTAPGAYPPPPGGAGGYPPGGHVGYPPGGGPGAYPPGAELTGAMAAMSLIGAPSPGGGGHPGNAYGGPPGGHTPYSMPPHAAGGAYGAAPGGYGGHGASPYPPTGAPHGGYGAPGAAGYGYDPHSAAVNAAYHGMAGVGGPGYLQGNRKALLIGINYLNSARGRLRGCINDVKKMKEFLKRYHYQESDMLILTDDQRDPSRQPTRANIIAGITWLVAGAAPGDCLFFHFSGHGGQVRDVSGDEDDGMDETILTCDNTQIIDDELHARMVRPLPMGCRLTAVMDCCHSGTGLDLPFEHQANYVGPKIQGAVKAKMTKAEKKRLKQQKKMEKKKKKGGGGGSGPGQLSYAAQQNISAADVILFSGCADNQTSADATIGGTATGAMTNAFVTTLTRNPHQTFNQMLASMREILHTGPRKYSQIPQLSTGRPLNLDVMFTL
eukprot:CAMPEP_0174236186 /NCGR_PEP_ID=MMETSP0417-20130205/5391_1 /TAXON_ID=242541 /ORGANISM="Mayorella sp, Strain BSH-02190019" /LENGTH=527 /DNA_ID=CAMNT_0015314793 /DNA_START=30 /DNA_END=1613 /DNA_ORIENTATION=+